VIPHEGIFSNRSGVFMAIACDQIKADKATKNFVFNVVYDKKLNLPDYQLIKEAVLMVYDPNEQDFLEIKLTVENPANKTGQQLILEKKDYYKLFFKTERFPLKCLKINFNPISSPIFNSYDLDEKKPWIFPVTLKPKTIQLGSGRDKTQKQVGWILERDWTLDMQKPNFELYELHFGKLGYAP